MIRENNLTPLQQDDQKKILNALILASSTLKPYLVTLTPGERQELPKMTDRAVPFVQKALEHAQKNTDFMPSYINVKQLKTDFEAVTALMQIHRWVEQLYLHLSDTMSVCGGEVYIASLAFFNNVKEAATLDIPQAKVIAEDLNNKLLLHRKEVSRSRDVLKPEGKTANKRSESTYSGMHAVKGR